MSGEEFTTKELRTIGEEITREGIRLLHRGYRELRDWYLEHFKSDITQKFRLFADQDVEKEFAMKLKTYRNGRFATIKFFGEESFRRGEVDLHDVQDTCVLVDALDGSDLYEREMGNWCSAAIFFTPQNEPGKRIRAAIVGLPSEEIYIADDDPSRGVTISMPDRMTFRLDENNPNRRIVEIEKVEPRKLRGRSSVKKLVEASICFYGQKIKNLTKIACLDGWRSEKFVTTDEHQLVPRVYNLAGIPMILKLLDKPSETGSGVDLVFELGGQQPHDVVPGAFIAKRAGATVIDLAGNEFTYERMEEALLKPNVNRLTYIVASTPELASEAADNFSCQFVKGGQKGVENATIKTRRKPS